MNPRQQQTLEFGEAFARMYTPAFGSDFQLAIIEGTEEEALLTGPGHYVDTQMLGEAGNLAVEGHRVGKGEPFSDLGRLEVCDAIVVETRTKWITYQVLPINVAGKTRRAESAGCFTPE